MRAVVLLAKSWRSTHIKTLRRVRTRLTQDKPHSLKKRRRTLGILAGLVALLAIGSTTGVATAANNTGAGDNGSRRIELQAAITSSTTTVTCVWLLDVGVRPTERPLFSGPAMAGQSSYGSSVDRTRGRS